MSFGFDTFTDTNGTTLASHTASDATTWALHPSYTKLWEIQGNVARATDPNATSGLSCYYDSGSPKSADYRVQATINRVSTGAGGSPLVSVCGRVNTGANTMYCAQYNSVSGGWRLIKIVSGTATQLGLTVEAISSNTNYVLMLWMVGTAISLYVDGVLKVGPVTDSAVAAAGQAGFRAQCGNDSAAADFFTIDGFQAVDIETLTVAVPTAAITVATFAPSIGVARGRSRGRFVGAGRRRLALPHVPIT